MSRVTYRGDEAHPLLIDPEGNLRVAHTLFESLPGRTDILFEIDPTEGPA